MLFMIVHQIDAFWETRLEQIKEQNPNLVTKKIILLVVIHE